MWDWLKSLCIELRPCSKSVSHQAITEGEGTQIWDQGKKSYETWKHCLTVDPGSSY